MVSDVSFEIVDNTQHIVKQTTRQLASNSDISSKCKENSKGVALHLVPFSTLQFLPIMAYDRGRGTGRSRSRDRPNRGQFPYSSNPNEQGPRDGSQGSQHGYPSGRGGGRAPRNDGPSFHQPNTGYGGGGNHFGRYTLVNPIAQPFHPAGNFHNSYRGGSRGQQDGRGRGQYRDREHDQQYDGGRSTHGDGRGMCGGEASQSGQKGIRSLIPMMPNSDRQESPF
jgi:hypothetical protein